MTELENGTKFRVEFQRYWFQIHIRWLCWKKPVLIKRKLFQVTDCDYILYELYHCDNTYIRTFTNTCIIRLFYHYYILLVYVYKLLKLLLTILLRWIITILNDYLSISTMDLNPETKKYRRSWYKSSVSVFCLEIWKLWGWNCGQINIDVMLSVSNLWI